MITQNKNNNGILYLNTDTSLVLPYFDASSIANSNIDKITLSLYVLNKIPETSTPTQITINPIDLNTNNVDNGLSTFVNINKGSYIDFKLPKVLFEQTIRTGKRILVRLVSKDQKIVLKEPDDAGTTQDPRLIIEHGESSKNAVLDQPQIIENNYYNILNSQLHFGIGDNVGNNKINPNRTMGFSDIPLWLKYLVAITAILGFFWTIYAHVFSKNNSIQQFHSGTGDNIAGNKILNEFKAHFSENQSIKTLPPSLGGNDSLNLDNLAMLKLHVPYSPESITLLLDIVPTKLPDRREKDLTIEGAQYYYSQLSDTQYIFDARDNKRHEISLADRVFVVTLLYINKLDIADFPEAIEYQFGISEK